MKYQNFFNKTNHHGNALLVFLIILSLCAPSFGQTAQGELEGRPAPVARRTCLGGANAGSLCNTNGGCPGSTCVDRNVFNISVAVLFNATNAELTTIQNAISAGSADLFDATDGQAEIGLATIHNNTFSTGATADLRILPSTNSTGWVANTGNWMVGGSINVSIDRIQTTANPGEAFAHEFIHLVFDARDEYESRAVGCGAVSSGFSCPSPAAIAAGAVPCLMDNGGLAGDFSELCWGQGLSGDQTNFAAGNHDATNVTEQSRCRGNRSCWAQVVWSWPNTFQAPVGAPNAAANGATVNPTQFVVTNNNMRVVLVLDESNSMSLESPSRMSRLQVAALDFIALADNGTEVGIVSYSNDALSANGHASIPIAALGNNRANWNTSISGLTPGGWTNIGDGLQKALDMINNAGGPTANTAILLMSDGINNRPSPQATANTDLQNKVSALMAAGIPVFVTCTGSDFGLASQCSEIATGTGGLYVDSADPAQLSEAFIDFHERISRRDAIASYYNWRDNKNTNFFVEENSESVTFTLNWHDQDPKIKATMKMVDPNGQDYRSSDIPQGKVVKVNNPIPGDWNMIIDWGNAPKKFVTKGYSRNPIHSLTAGIRYASVLPGEQMYVYAYPQSYGGPITDSIQVIKAMVIRPDGTTDTFELDDQGSNGPGGDDQDFDGIFTGVYSKTNLKGSYEFILSAIIDQWETSHDNHEHENEIEKLSAKFTREARISGAVGDPKDIVDVPEDTPQTIIPDKDKCPLWLLGLVLLLGIILGLFLCKYFRRRKG